MHATSWFDAGALIRDTCPNKDCGLPKGLCACFPVECCWCTPHHMIAGFEDDPRKVSSGMCKEAAKKWGQKS